MGVRQGMHDAAERLRSHGHDVHVVDQYDGKVFDDYDTAGAYVEQVGFPALMAIAAEATADLPDPLVTMGFSNGAGMAEFVAGQRPVAGVVMMAGSLDPAVINLNWPSGVPGQIHTTIDDPRRDQAAIDNTAAAIRAAGGEVEVFDYPGSGHLFADPSKTDEYQPAEAELMWTRVLEFLARVDSRSAATGT